MHCCTHHNPCKTFQIHLMNNTRFRGHHFEVIKAVLAPTQKSVTLSISFKFKIRVVLKRQTITKIINLHRMIDHQFRRAKRIDLGRVAPHQLHGIAHCCKIDNCGNAREILQQNSGRSETDFLRRNALRIPIRKCLYICLGNTQTIFGSQKIFQKNLKRKRKLGYLGQLLL